MTGTRMITRNVNLETIFSIHLIKFWTAYLFFSRSNSAKSLEFSWHWLSFISSDLFVRKRGLALIYKNFNINSFLIWSFNPWTYTQSHTPTVVQGGRGVDGTPLPWVFDVDMLILPSVESLWSSQQEEIYLMGGSVASGLWRHQQGSDFTKN